MTESGFEKQIGRRGRIAWAGKGKQRTTAEKQGSCFEGYTVQPDVTCIAGGFEDVRKKRKSKTG